MRPFPERSKSQVNINEKTSGGRNGDHHRLTNGSSNPAEESIVTRSKSVKLRSSGRSMGVSRSPPLMRTEPKNSGCSSERGRVSRNKNGVLSRRRNKLLSSVTNNNNSATGLRCERSKDSAYARHYKSYRRRLSTTTTADGGGAASSSRHQQNGSYTGASRGNDNCQRSRLSSYHHHENGMRKKHVSPRTSLRSGLTYRKSTCSSLQKRNIMGRSLLGDKKERGAKNLLVSPVSSSCGNSSSSCASLNSNHDGGGGRWAKNGTSRTPVGGEGAGGGAKRRSALWVLNCEAEEFLFGETAAEKHELELPPSCSESGRLSSTSNSSTPKKRRRWREGELSHLLETSPFLESKLPSCSSSSESGRDSNFDLGSSSPPPKKRKPLKREEGKRRRRPAKKYKSQKLSLSGEGECSMIRADSLSNRLEELGVVGNLELLSPTCSSIESLSRSRERSDPKSVELRQLLGQLPWTFSFEVPAVDEPWYRTFSRPGDAIASYTSLLSPYFEPILLPYELEKGFQRSRRGRLGRNSRKSPRCHASTLAILSSEGPPAAARTPAGHSLNDEPPPIASLSSEVTGAPSASSSTTRVGDSHTKSPASPTCVHHHSTNVLSHSQQQFGKNTELSAQQYLWDSIQFLSDQYVVSLLAGEEPTDHHESLPPPATPTLSTNSKSRSRHNSNYNKNSSSADSCCPLKKFVQNFEALERKASLRSCEGGPPLVPPGSKESGGSSPPTTRTIRMAKSSPRGAPSQQLNGTNYCGLLTLNGISKCVENGSLKLSCPSSEQKTKCSPPTHPHNNNVNVNSKRGTTTTHKSTSVNNNNNNNSECVSKGGVGRSRLSRVAPAPEVEHLEVETPVPSSTRRVNRDSSSRKSPVVIVSDIFKCATGGTAKVKKLRLVEEKVLFLGDGLPPLPSWPQ